MGDLFNSNRPEPRKVGVWSEGTYIQAKELVVPNKSPDSSDDIPTLPDLDDLQDILAREISAPPETELKDTETVNILAEVSDEIHGGSKEGLEAALEVLKSFVPEVDSEIDDTIWTVNSLLAQLADEDTDSV